MSQGPLRSADSLLSPGVEATLADLTLTDADTALVRLARLYARAIDDDTEGDALEKLGPKLLATLSALGATPVVRARHRTGKGDTGGPSRLEQLRQQRSS